MMLPTDVWHVISQHVENCNDLYALKRVSHQLNNVIDEWDIKKRWGEKHGIVETAKRGYTDILEYLIKEKGIDITIENNVIIEAIVNKHADTLQKCIEIMNDSVKTIDVFKRYALNCILAKHGNADMIYMFSQLRNCENNFSSHAMVIAARNGNANILRACVETGANIASGNNEAIRWAARNGHTKTLKTCAELGANIECIDNEAIINAVKFNHIKTVKECIKLGADVSTKDNMPVHLAIQNGNNKMIRLLVKHGAHI